MAQKWWSDALVDAIVVHGPKLFQEGFKKGKEVREKKRGDKLTFAQAMAELRLIDPHAHDVLVDFMTTFLTDMHDQEDFQVNASDTGPAVADTVKFLQDVASLADHDERKAFLNAIGHIGARSVDLLEHTEAILKWIGEHVSKVNLAKIQDAYDAVTKQIKDWDAKPAVVTAAANIKTRRDASVARLKAKLGIP